MAHSNIIDNRTDLLCIDNTFIKVHSDAIGALKKWKTDIQTAK